MSNELHPLPRHFVSPLLVCHHAPTRSWFEQRLHSCYYEPRGRSCTQNPKQNNLERHTVWTRWGKKPFTMTVDSFSLFVWLLVLSSMVLVCVFSLKQENTILTHEIGQKNQYNGIDRSWMILYVHNITARTFFICFYYDLRGFLSLILWRFESKCDVPTSFTDKQNSCPLFPLSPSPTVTYPVRSPPVPQSPNPSHPATWTPPPAKPQPHSSQSPSHT